MLPSDRISGSHRFFQCGIFVAALLSLLASAPARADLVFGTLRTSETGYGFGSFDISSPTGAPGSYSYGWTSVLSNEPDLADLARDPDSGEMYVMVDPFGAKSYRSITATGVMASLGTPTDTVYSMAFDNPTGDLYAYSLTASDVWQQLDPSNGSTLTAGGLTGAQTFPYSSFGGNMTGAATGGFYFANEFPQAELVKITPDGSNASTVIIGTMAGTAFDATKVSIPFVWGSTLHVLNQDRLYTVNETDASLTLLGTVTGLPGDFTAFTGVAVPFVVVTEVVEIEQGHGQWSWPPPGLVDLPAEFVLEVAAVVEAGERVADHEVPELLPLPQAGERGAERLRDERSVLLKAWRLGCHGVTAGPWGATHIGSHLDPFVAHV
jgi:hypothetical protein